MARTTRSKAPVKATSNEDTTVEQTMSQLPVSEVNPPKVFVLPKDISKDANVVTLPNPSNSKSSRFLFCPEKGIFEFTRIAAPKSSPRSWLVTREKKPNGAVSNAVSNDKGNGKVEGEESAVSGKTEKEPQDYILRGPDMFIATPFDELFLLLPILSSPSEASTQQKNLFLSLDDHFDRIHAAQKQLQFILQNSQFRRRLERRVRDVCDTVEAGDESMFRLSMAKLFDEILVKAKRMAANGLPPSMEEHFVRRPLQVPVTNVMNETGTEEAIPTSAMPIECAELPEVDEDTNTATGASTSAASQSSAPTSQPTTSTSTSQSSFTSNEDAPSTAATSPSHTQPQTNSIPAPSNELSSLLRLRVSFTHLLSSYIPIHLHSPLLASLKASTDFTVLESHLSALRALTAETTALRQMSDNISRKRSMFEDDEAEAGRAEKKRKKEEEEKRKKQESRGVKALGKADVSGMKKMSSFFTKVPKK